jgi:hypothetical protein
MMGVTLPKEATCHERSARGRPLRARRRLARGGNIGRRDG